MSDAIIRRLLASLDDYEGAQKAVVRWADLEQVIAIAQRAEKLQGELGTLRADLAAATARAEAAEAEREVFCALLLLDALSFISDFNRRNDILAPSMSQLRLKVREYFRNAIDIAGDNRMLMRATPEAAARVRELLDAYVEPKEGQP